MADWPAGITMQDNLMNLDVGWFVMYKDGSVVTEKELKWPKVVKGQIEILGLKWHDKVWSIRGKTAWLQFKVGSVPFALNGLFFDSDIFCEERCIGYYEGKNKIVYRVNNRTGRMRLGVLEG